MKKLILFVAVAALAMSACGGSSGGGGGTGGTAMAGLATCTVASATTGVVCGKAVAADGTTPLIGAEVRLGTPATSTSAPLASVNKGVENPSQCVSDSSGNFACVVPEGQTGTLSFFLSLTGFSDTTFQASISAGATTDSGTLAMSGSASGQWVVVPGSFDGVQVLLSQLKGCTLSDGAGNPFDPATMDPATARASTECTDLGLLVLNDWDTTSDTYVPTFLTGSSLASYQSLFINCDADWSGTTGVDAAIQAYNTAGGHIYFSDLADSWLTSAFPGVITFFGYSTMTGTVSSAVPYAPLAAVVGDPINVIFDLGAWAAMDSVAAGVTTYIQGDISTVSSYTGVRPITVGWRPSSSTGCVFYTSYHIEGAGTGTGIPQEDAIKYLVQNISSVCQ